jgi:N-acetylglucosaminyl-diphospho-decaprenol L-rhamnosyltransferase
MQPELTLVFVNYNSTSLLDQALRSLRRAEPGGSVEVLVADNASTDRSAVIDTCRRYGARLLLLSRNLGIASAANRALRHARGRYLAVANPDIILARDVLASLVRFMDATPDAGAAAPQLLYEDGTPQPTAKRYPRLRYVLGGRRSLLARLFPGGSGSAEFLYSGIDRAPDPVRVESVIGALVVFRREAFEGVAGFDEGYFMYAEDTDICRRLNRDWRVYLVPSLRATHLAGQTRKSYIGLSEFHRIRSHRRFFLSAAHGPAIVLLSLLFAAYLMGQQAAGLAGVREFEYSWQSRVVRP